MNINETVKQLQKKTDTLKKHLYLSYALGSVGIILGIIALAK